MLGVVDSEEEEEEDVMTTEVTVEETVEGASNDIL